jgi:membrane associated rhomboid family serine protease
MNIEYLKKYFQNFPVTSFVLLINVIIFLLNRSGQIYPIVSVPGVLNLQSVLANFSHYDLMHFIFNMLILWQISPLIEVKFRGIYYFGIILSLLSLVTLGVARFSESPTLGFSGIGLGLMVFAGFLYWDDKYIAKQLIGWAVANILIGLIPGISFVGHLTGALAGGFVFGIVYYLLPRK